MQTTADDKVLTSYEKYKMLSEENKKSVIRQIETLAKSQSANQSSCGSQE